MDIKANVTGGSPKDYRCSVLYQGQSGSGKTHNAFSWPNPLGIYTEVNKATLEKMEGIPYLLPDAWNDNINDLELKLLPVLEKREAEQFTGGVEVKTIVVDSLTDLLADAMRTISGPEGKMSQQNWGRFLIRGETLVRRFVELSMPRAGHPGYHVVCTIHEKDVTDEVGTLLRVSPAIGGQLKDLVSRFFDTVLLCQSSVDVEVSKGSGPATRILTPNYKVWTMPPDAYRLNIKDGVGGGRFNKLPTTCDGTYPSLAKAWGLEQESE